MSTDNSTPETIAFQVTRGKTATVSSIDADLAELKWTTRFAGNTTCHSPYHLMKRNPHSQSQPRKGPACIWIHRIIMERIIGRPLLRTEYIDHINGDGLDNRRENLRIAGGSGNQRNKKRMSSNTSGFKGVSKYGNKWRARSVLNGKEYCFGYFNTPEEAYEVWKVKAKELHGEFFNPG